MKRILCLALCAAAGVAVAAGIEELEPPPTERFLKVGPLRLRPQFHLSELGYDDNIFFNPAGDKVGDYTYTVSPALEGLAFLGRRSFFTFSGEFDYTGYLDHPDQNFSEYGTAARLTLPLRSLGGFVDYASSRSKQRPIDQEDIRPERKEGRLGLGLIAQPGSRMTVRLGANRSDLRYSDPDTLGRTQTISERLDRNESSLDVNIEYRVRGRTRLTLSGQSRSLDFLNDFVSGDEQFDHDSRERQVVAGVRLDIGGPLVGVLRIGTARIDAKDPRLQDLSTAIGKMELIYRLTDRTRVRLEAERAPGFAVYEGNNYYLRTDYELRTIHYLNRVFGVEGGVGRGRLSFPASPTATEREDRVRTYDFGVRVRIVEDSEGRKIEYGLRVGRYRRESTIPLVEQSRGTVFAGLTFDF